MNRCTSKSKTAKLVYMMALIKENELHSYRQKVMDMEKTKSKGANNALYEYKQALVVGRFHQLIKTLKDLKQLERELEGLFF
ncbi:hypothetical protein [Flagellimonas nanhaiensis]|nr:hypothetical protein [Allomuricauda nanhaiensis]